MRRGNDVINSPSPDFPAPSKYTVEGGRESDWLFSVTIDCCYPPLVMQSILGGLVLNRQLRPISFTKGLSLAEMKTAGTGQSVFYHAISPPSTAAGFCLHPGFVSLVAEVLKKNFSSLPLILEYAFIPLAKDFSCTFL